MPSSSQKKTHLHLTLMTSFISVKHCVTQSLMPSWEFRFRNESFGFAEFHELRIHLCSKKYAKKDKNSQSRSEYTCIQLNTKCLEVVWKDWSVPNIWHKLLLNPGWFVERNMLVFHVTISATKDLIWAAAFICSVAPVKKVYGVPPTLF